MKATLLFTFILGATTGYTQPTIVKNDAVQVLYIGAENPITVRVNNYKPSQLTVKPSVGEVRKVNNNGSYIWKVCESKITWASISIYCGKQLIKKIPFLLKTTPMDPYVDSDGWPGGFRDGGPRSIFHATHFTVKFPELTMPNIECAIISFHVTRSRNMNLENEAFRDTLISEAFNVGASFNSQVKQLVSSSKPGDTIIVDKIIVQVGCEPKPRELSAKAWICY